jgi:hypothetical protein
MGTALKAKMPVARILLGVVTATAVVLWLSSSPVSGWLLIAMVAVSAVFGVRASVAQKRMERQWVRSLWTKWKSVI